MSSSTIPHITYSEFGRLIRAKTAQVRYPYSCCIEITPECNLRCVHCYVSHCKWEEPVLRYQEWCHIIDQIVDEGCLWLLITGGEPLLHPDFLDIYKYAKKKGMFVSLFTNGTLITPEIADAFTEYQTRGVEITLYGATKKTYEKVTGVAGSYERCIRGIELLLERKIPLSLKTVAITINKDEVMAMKEYALKLGLKFKWDPNIMPRLDHRMEPVKFRLTPEEIIKLELEFPERLDDWHKFCTTHWGPFSEEALYLCGAGKQSCFIDPYGKLSLCVSARSQNYDLRRGSFHDGWHKFFPEILNQKASPENKCQKCELSALCGRCASWAEMETGDPNGVVEWLCNLAHCRVKALGLKKEIPLK
jgi:radical SAM protein with 4Fe4S-binding SPASM domain